MGSEILSSRIKWNIISNCDFVMGHIHLHKNAPWERVARCKEERSRTARTISKEYVQNVTIQIETSTKMYTPFLIGLN